MRIRESQNRNPKLVIDLNTAKSPEPEVQSQETKSRRMQAGKEIPNQECNPGMQSQESGARNTNTVI